MLPKWRTEIKRIQNPQERCPITFIDKVEQFSAAFYGFEAQANNDLMFLKDEMQKLHTQQDKKAFLDPENCKIDT